MVVFVKKYPLMTGRIVEHIRSGFLTIAGAYNDCAYGIGPVIYSDGKTFGHVILLVNR
jgi:hypothetical protein